MVSQTVAVIETPTDSYYKFNANSNSPGFLRTYFYIFGCYGLKGTLHCTEILAHWQNLYV